MWDAHCHLDDPRLAEDRDAVVERARQVGIRGLIVPGVSSERWCLQEELVRLYPEVFVAYGLHPWVVAGSTRVQVVSQLTKLKERFSQPSMRHVVGVGEMGLDRSSKALQQSFGLQEWALREQLALARELELPVILHVVHAHGAMLSLLKRDGLPKRGGMVHAFAGSVEVAREYNRLGLYVSLGGLMTWPRAKKAQRAAIDVELRWLLCETDAPDMPLAPDKKARNEPSQVRTVLEYLSKLRGMAVGELCEVTTINTRQLFGIGD